MIYEYPTLIQYDKNDEVYYVDFPDVPGCFTDGRSLQEAIENADDALNLMLTFREKQGETIAPPSDKNSFELKPGEIVAMITADTEAYAKMYPPKKNKIAL